MDIKDLSLEGVTFTAPPTKTQLVNTLSSISKFLQRVGGAVIADGSYHSGDEPVAILFNGALHLKVAAEKFEAGPSQAGIVHAMPAPPANPGGPRRA